MHVRVCGFSSIEHIQYANTEDGSQRHGNEKEKYDLHHETDEIDFYENRTRNSRREVMISRRRC